MLIAMQATNDAVSKMKHNAHVMDVTIMHEDMLWI